MRHMTQTDGLRHVTFRQGKAAAHAINLVKSL
jgi:hypothetical protein